jgi:putative hydrolase
MSTGQMIDWDVAVATGVRWARPGPQVSLAEARRCVAELRELSGTVHDPVERVSGLTSPEISGRVAVVDRSGWIRANVDGFRVVLEPLVEQLRENQQGRMPAFPAPGSLLGSVGPRVTGMQVGLILAYLAGRVLGQYELFLPPESGTAAAQPGTLIPDGPGATAGNGAAAGGAAGAGAAPDPGSADGAGNGAAADGRLTLVAPNILMVERELRVNAHDFRLWVCLHEETHRVQFTAVPWLRGYVQQQMKEFLLASDLDPAAILDRLRAAGGAVAGAVRSGATGSGDGASPSLLEAIQNPRQRAVLDRLTAVMTLVEGHGDYVMDAVGPEVVPSVEQIRSRFSARRTSVGRIEQAVRRILGIDLKMKQYAEGSRFVRTVIGEIGVAGFNRVWESPETLPTRDEITNPRAWINRVTGGGALAAGEG